MWRRKIALRRRHPDRSARSGKRMIRRRGACGSMPASGGPGVDSSRPQRTIGGNIADLRRVWHKAVVEARELDLIYFRWLDLAFSRSEREIESLDLRGGG